MQTPWPPSAWIKRPSPSASPMCVGRPILPPAEDDQIARLPFSLVQSLPPVHAPKSPVGELQVGVAQELDAAEFVGELGEAGAVQAERGAAAPEVGRPDEAPGRGRRLPADGPQHLTLEFAHVQCPPDLRVHQVGLRRSPGSGSRSGTRHAHSRPDDRPASPARTPPLRAAARYRLAWRSSASSRSPTGHPASNTRRRTVWQSPSAR